MHSTVTKKGQTTIPGEVRTALKIRPGDKLEYKIEGDHATIRVHPGASSLAGALKSDKGRGLTFAEIRRIAAKNEVRRLKSIYGEPKVPKKTRIIRRPPR